MNDNINLFQLRMNGTLTKIATPFSVNLQISLQNFTTVPLRNYTPRQFEGYTNLD